MNQYKQHALQASWPRHETTPLRDIQSESRTGQIVCLVLCYLGVFVLLNLF